MLNLLPILIIFGNKNQRFNFQKYCKPNTSTHCRYYGGMVKRASKFWCLCHYIFHLKITNFPRLPWHISDYDITKLRLSILCSPDTQTRFNTLAEMSAESVVEGKSRREGNRVNQYRRSITSRQQKTGGNLGMEIETECYVEILVVHVEGEKKQP